MALSKCKECGNQVSTEAKVCPNCGVSSPAVQAKKKMSRGTKWFLYLIGIGIFGNVFLSSKKPQDVSKSPTQNSSAVAKTPTYTPQEVKPSADDVCRNKGDAIATVFFANFDESVKVGLTASAMMNMGCKKETGECINLCEDGFKYRAKQIGKS